MSLFFPPHPFQDVKRENSKASDWVLNNLFCQSKRYQRPNKLGVDWSFFFLLCQIFFPNLKLFAIWLIEFGDEIHSFWGEIFFLLSDKKKHFICFVLICCLCVHHTPQEKNNCFNIFFLSKNDGRKEVESEESKGPTFFYH